MNEVTKEQVVEYLSNLPVIQIAELVKELEEKWGVSAAPVVTQQSTPTPGDDDAAADQTEFDVVLETIGEKKINVIKAVREATGLGLKEAKEKVEAAPGVILEATDKEKAEEVKKKLEEAGAKVILK